jgi:hypothetical protein
MTKKKNERERKKKAEKLKFLIGALPLSLSSPLTFLSKLIAYRYQE